ncbi:MAG: hypothetical protein JKY31_09270 [Rhodobacteraceae bacterium]|nr:hypothetical protein [Paracoccaceae bacterium]
MKMNLLSKTCLLLSQLTLAMSSAASADIAFVGGTVVLDATKSGDDGLYKFDAEVELAFRIDNVGLQFGVGETLVTNFSDVEQFRTNYSVHAYYYLQNRVKIGVSYSDSYIGKGHLTAYRIETMLALGSVDIEAIFGTSNYAGGNSYFTAATRVYYEIAPTLELNARYSMSVDENGEYVSSSYGAGVSYNIPNSELDVYANYNFSQRFQNQQISIGLQLNFGPESDERIFTLSRIY